MDVKFKSSGHVRATSQARHHWRWAVCVLRGLAVTVARALLAVSESTHIRPSLGTARPRTLWCRPGSPRGQGTSTASSCSATAQTRPRTVRKSLTRLLLTPVSASLATSMSAARRPPRFRTRSPFPSPPSSRTTHTSCLQQDAPFRLSTQPSPRPRIAFPHYPSSIGTPDIPPTHPRPPSTRLPTSLSLVMETSLST